MQNLEALAAQADAIDHEQLATEPGAMLEAAQADAQAAAVIETATANEMQVRMMLDLAMPILGALYPSLPAVYPEEVRAAVAMSLAPVLVKYNVNLGDLGSKYREEIGALLVCGPVALATVKAIKTDIAARAEAGKGQGTKQGDKAAPAAPIEAEQVVTLG